MPKTKQRLTEAERAQRRSEDRQRLQTATRELLSSEGWQRWVRTRATLHDYSLNNCLLLALQCHQRGIEPRAVAGFKAWLKLGRCVRKGEKALTIFAPMPVRRRDEDRDEPDEPRVLFRRASVFADTQTEPLPGVEPAPLEPPRVAVDGDSHAHLMAPLTELADEIGFSMRFAALPDGAGGYCDYQAKRIVVATQQAANAQVRVAIHELAHALGASSERFGRQRAEVIVECAAFVVTSGVGLDTSGSSVPYVAGWGEDGALEAVTEAAELIDAIASRIEAAITDADTAQTHQPSPARRSRTPMLPPGWASA